MENVAQAKELYGLIHNRFITTGKGLAMIREKYLNGVYGHCPRILCDKQILLPVGLSEDLKYSRVKVSFYLYRFIVRNARIYINPGRNVVILMEPFLGLHSLMSFYL